jgi:hypothetical protein
MVGDDLNRSYDKQEQELEKVLLSLRYCYLVGLPTVAGISSGAPFKYFFLVEKLMPSRAKSMLEHGVDGSCAI